MRYGSFILIVLLGLVNRSSAQVKLVLSGGLNYSDVYVKNAPGDYTATYTPNVGMRLVVPIVPKLIMETGLEYEMKGFKSDATYLNDKKTGKNIYISRTQYHYARVPLLLSFQVYKKDKGTVWLGGGIDYGFMVYANVSETWKAYTGNNLDFTRKYTYQPKATLVPSESIVPLSSPASLYMFDPAVKLQLTYWWDERYSVRLFHSYSLYDHNITQGKTIMHLNTTGISIGMFL